MGSAFYIHNENESDVVASCCKILNLYLDNILQHPDEQKYRKIKTANKTFTERVACCRGVEAFFSTVGMFIYMVL